MRIRTSPLIVGALFIASSAFAQVDSVRRTSTSRIPISKEPARVDTVTVYRTDTVTRTITRRIHDTVRVRRVDTVKTAPGVLMPIPLREIGGFYVGLAMGAAVPTGNDFTSFQRTGWHIELPLGWDPVGSFAGVRLTPQYSQFSKRGIFDQTFVTPEVFQTDLNLKLRYPAESPWMRRFQVYATGGGSYAAVRALAQFNQITGIITVGDSTGRATTINFGFPSTVDNDWHSAWGWNAGGGIQMGWKRTNVFLESRYSSLTRNGFTLGHVPIILGASWF